MSADKPMIELTWEPIDGARVLAAVNDPRAGACVLFVGTTRQFTEQRETVMLQYEAYTEMARSEMEKLGHEAARQWPVVKWAMVHRLGNVDIGQASVAIAVSTPHRADAFAAGQWLIDQLKVAVPIWKRERWSDGSVSWIHPDAELPSQAGE